MRIFHHCRDLSLTALEITSKRFPFLRPILILLLEDRLRVPPPERHIILHVELRSRLVHIELRLELLDRFPVSSESVHGGVGGDRRVLLVLLWALRHWEGLITCLFNSLAGVGLLGREDFTISE